jgi:hypothetical protein
MGGGGAGAEKTKSGKGNSFHNSCPKLILRRWEGGSPEYTQLGRSAAHLYVEYKYRSHSHRVYILTECWPCPLFDILLNKYYPAG